MYFEGRGVLQDKKQSRDWYSKACNNGDQPSCDQYAY
ncbi:hypothetical protein [Psychrobacter sp. JCM 18900]